MPLSKARMRERKRRDRLVKPTSNLDASFSVKPNRLETAQKALAEAVKPKTDALQSKSRPLKEESNSKPPLYNPRVHGPGDLVRKYVSGRYIEVVVQEVDAEGNRIW